jgi:hypothetical protein
VIAIARVIDNIPGTVVPLQECPARDLGPTEFWDRFVSTQTPAVIRGAAKEWPAVSTWSDDKQFRAKTAGLETQHVPVFRAVCITLSYPGLRKPEFLPATTAIGNVLDGAEDEQHYVEVYPSPPSWERDLGAFEFLAGRHDRPPYYYPRRRYYVYRNAPCDWHEHTIDETLTVQLRASKRFSLFRLDPSNRSAYVSALRLNLHHIANGHWYFPPESKLLKSDVVLNPGDAIYIPPFVWHGIEPIGPDVGVTHAYCFRSPIACVGSLREPGSRRLVRTHLVARRWRKAGQFLGLFAASAYARWRNGKTWSNIAGRGTPARAG